MKETGTPRRWAELAYGRVVAPGVPAVPPGAWVGMVAARAAVRGDLVAVRGGAALGTVRVMLRALKPPLGEDEDA